MSARANYIVFAPGYDPDSGGSIFLHQLVHALNEAGEKAFLWHWHTPRATFGQRFHAVLKRPSLLWKQRPFVRDAMLNTPIAQPSDLTENSIVVYPEVTLGNPLAAQHVARWLLYKPGLRAPYSFSAGEMFFRAGEMSDLPELTGGAPELFVWRINPVYRDEGRPDRSGACFIVRKGEAKPRIAQTAEAIQIDGMSHAEIADVFNRCTTFYSYDEATLYSQYAAICGCDSVVVPGFYAARADWVQSHELARFGVAYGLDDLAHARATRHLTLGVLQAQEAKGTLSVQNFVRLTQSRFG